MATILYYIGVVLLGGGLIIGLIAIFADPTGRTILSSISFYVVGWFVAVMLIFTSMFLPADKSHYYEKVDVYDLAAQGNNVYAVKDVEMRGMKFFEVINVHYFAGTGIESEMNFDVDENLEIKTGKPQIVIITYEANSRYTAGELPDTRYVLYLPTPGPIDLKKGDRL